MYIIRCDVPRKSGKNAVSIRIKISARSNPPGTAIIGLGRVMFTRRQQRRRPCVMDSSPKRRRKIQARPRARAGSITHPLGGVEHPATQGGLNTSPPCARNTKGEKTVKTSSSCVFGRKRRNGHVKDPRNAPRIRRPPPAASGPDPLCDTTSDTITFKDLGAAATMKDIKEIVLIRWTVGMTIVDVGYPGWISQSTRRGS
ncbi:hypothetical protein QTP88_004284 [Uroleucon formosanum]